MRKIVAFIDCGLFSVKVWKDFNFLRTLMIELEYSYGQKEKVFICDLKEKLKAFDIRTIELYDDGLIRILFYDDLESISLP